MATDRPAIRVRGLCKSFPGVQALADVSFDVNRSEVHAVVGENGAGKSTLMKILSGALEPDSGELEIFGQPVRDYRPEAARDLGVAIIYQEFNLIPHLSVAENIALGREPARRGWISRRQELQQASGVLADLGFVHPLGARVYRLNVAGQQLVEIAKALVLEAGVLIMDEPASALSEREREHLFAQIGRLRGKGITILYVSHSLDEVFRLADRITVIKDGRFVSTDPVQSTSPDEVITRMVGRKLERVFPSKAQRVGPPLLTVTDLRSPPELHSVSFSVHQGEILGIYGLVGAGRTELCKAIFGARPRQGGLVLEGRPRSLRSPTAAVREGVAYLTEDRKSEGLVLDLSIRKNLALPSLRDRQKLGVIDQNAERNATSAMVESLGILAPSQEQPVVSLSGGNQQKVLIGKWLLANPRVLLCDEPTRGVDVGTKMEIYRHLRALADRGLGIIMISSELPEILGMSDRVVVMRRGELAAELSGAEVDEESLLAAAIGERSAASAPERSAASAPAVASAPSAAERRLGTSGRAGLGSSRAAEIIASNLAVYLALVALFVAGVVASSSFVGVYNLTSIVRHAVALGIVAFGQAAVMLAGGVDLSVSSTITMTTILSAGLMAGRNFMILPAVLVCLVVGLLFGTVNGLSVVVLRIPPFIATLGVLSIGRGVVLVITHGPVGSIGGAFRSFARGSLGPIPSALVIIVVLIVFASLLMNRTTYGRHLFAIGGDREVARLAGIRTRGLEFTTYLVSGASAVVAGLYLTSRMGVGDPSVGPGFELDSIIAVLIGGIPFGGGKGNVVGVFAGVLLLAVLGNLLNLLNLHSWYHQIAKAAILLIAISLVRKEK